MYNILWNSWNEHNIVNKLYPNEKKIFKTLKSKETTKQGRGGKFIHHISLGLSGGQGSKQGRRGVSVSGKKC